jgi:hypothetical protein
MFVPVKRPTLMPRAPHGDTIKSANLRSGNRRFGALFITAPRRPPEIPLRVAIHREVKKLSHNERTKADWPLTRGAFFLLSETRRQICTKCKPIPFTPSCP